MRQISRTLAWPLVALTVVMASVITQQLTAQIAFRDLDVSTLRSPGPGYYFIAPNSMDSISMLDHAGKNVFKRRVGPHANVLTYKNKWLTHFATVGNTPVFVRRDVNLNPIDTLRAVNGAKTDFHECRIISDTSYIILGIREDTVDLSKIRGGNPRAVVWNNVIQERTFSGRTLFEWRSLDHIPVTDAIDSIEVTTPLVDYIHINSVVVDTDGNFLVSCRHTDEVIKINRTSGAVMWRLGGSFSKRNQFTWLNDSTGGFRGFCHQHSAIRTARGTILLFDNGNFKPGDKASRVVEYEVDEVAKTVRKVFEFMPSPTIYAPTMGSVQELPNGNIVIGWGSGSNRTVAHEVDRSGTIQVRIDNPTQNGFVAYRVVKAVYAMTGIERVVKTPSTITFDDADSTTYVAVTTTRVTDSTRITVERHNYPPHSIAFTDTTYCSVLPMRWTIRAADTSAIAGTIRFSVRGIRGITLPAKALLFARPREGRGPFTRVPAGYDNASGTLTTSSMRYGEFLVAFADCTVPEQIFPSNGSFEIPTAVQLRWSPALQTGGYEVEVSQSPAFTDAQRFVVFDEDTAVQGLSNYTRYYWRIRGILPSGTFSSWSSVWSFVTQLSIPTLRSPVLQKDTVATLTPVQLVWFRTPSARTYRYRVAPLDRQSDSLTSVTADTVVRGLSSLRPNTWYEWSVRPISDSGIVGRWSEITRFITSPRPPVLRTPAQDAEDVTTDRPRFEWLAVDSAVRYVIAVRRASDGQIVHLDSTSGTFNVPDTLPMNARCLWNVRAVGRYGTGPVSASWSLLTRTSFIIDPPITIAPKNVDQVDTVMTSMLWARIDGATSYDLQITSQGTFANPEVEILGLSNPFCDVPSLRPGTAYRWRVIGYSDTAVGRWSDTASFTTRPRFTQSLVPVFPERNTVDVPLRGVLRYSGSPAYTEYESQFSRDPFFASIDHTFRSFADTAHYFGLDPGTLYYWRVVGFLPGDQSESGEASSFTTTTSTGVDDAAEEEVKVSVTPDGVSIQVKSAGRFRVALFDILGRQAVTGRSDGAGATVFIPTATLPRGCYLLEIQGDESSLRHSETVCR